MTNLEFNEAMAVLIQHGRAAIDYDAMERVYLAACQVLRVRRKDIPDDQPIYLTDSEVIDVLTNADRRQRKLLKIIAEGLIKETDIYKH